MGFAGDADSAELGSSSQSIWGKCNHDRVSVMLLNSSGFNLIVIDIYMPFLNRSDLQHSLSEHDEVLGYIKCIMADFAIAQFIILGDFNCSVSDLTHPFETLLSDFIRSHGLYNAFRLMDSFSAQASFTRYDSHSKSIQ